MAFAFTENEIVHDWPGLSFKLAAQVPFVPGNEPPVKEKDPAVGMRPETIVTAERPELRTCTRYFF